MTENDLINDTSWHKDEGYQEQIDFIQEWPVEKIEGITI